MSNVPKVILMNEKQKLRMRLDQDLKFYKCSTFNQGFYMALVRNPIWAKAVGNVCMIFLNKYLDKDSSLFGSKNFVAWSELCNPLAKMLMDFDLCFKNGGSFPTEGSPMLNMAFKEANDRSIFEDSQRNIAQAMKRDAPLDELLRDANFVFSSWKYVARKHAEAALFNNGWVDTQSAYGHGEVTRKYGFGTGRKKAPCHLYCRAGTSVEEYLDLFDQHDKSRDEIIKHSENDKERPEEGKERSQKFKEPTPSMRLRYKQWEKSIIPLPAYKRSDAKYMFDSVASYMSTPARTLVNPTLLAGHQICMELNEIYPEAKFYSEPIRGPWD